MCKEVLLTFLNKYFFILKAASEGWRVTYNGGNEFEFIQALKNVKYEKEEFITRYTSTVALKENISY
jgi:hypothetical protein